MMTTSSMTTSTPGNLNDGVIAAVVLRWVEQDEEDKTIVESYKSKLDGTLEAVIWRLKARSTSILAKGRFKYYIIS